MRSRFTPHRHPGEFMDLDEAQAHVRRFHPGLEPPGAGRDASFRTLTAAHRREHGAHESPAPQAPRSPAELAAAWRLQARVLRVAANRLGDSRIGLEAFTEACVREACAAELDSLPEAGR